MWPCFVWQQFSGQISAAIRHSRIKTRFISWCRRNRLSGKRKTTKRSAKWNETNVKVCSKLTAVLNKGLEIFKAIFLTFYNTEPSSTRTTDCPTMLVDLLPPQVLPVRSGGRRWPSAHHVAPSIGREKLLTRQTASRARVPWAPCNFRH